MPRGEARFRVAPVAVFHRINKIGESGVDLISFEFSSIVMIREGKDAITKQT